jgi:serine/threonine protein kinase
MLRVDEQKLFTTNEIIAEQYRIIEFLGQPDKGLLYKAKHIPSNTTVIIRALSPDNPFDEKSKQRFLKRAKILTSLNHSNIARTLDFGFLENDAPYLITEYPEGQTLAEINKIKRQCDFRIALPIFKNVCLALAYIHGQNAAHGAIRPDNIILIKNS